VAATGKDTTLQGATPLDPRAWQNRGCRLNQTCNSKPAARSAGLEALKRKFALGEANRIGGGDEADVYAIGADRLVKVYGASADRAMIARRNQFYAGLDRSIAGFATPQILESGECDGTVYTVERRIPGASLAQMLLRMEGAARERALLAYTKTAAEIRRLPCVQDGFGEVLASDPIRRPSWDAFLLARAGECLARNMGRLVGTVEHPERPLRRLEELAARRSGIAAKLVHGDYYPDNVLVDSTGDVTGVIDFGTLTVAGDPDMDLAGAVLYLLGMAGVTARDKQVVEESARSLGLTDQAVALYRLYYAFRFLGTDRDVVFRWCLDALRAAI
jgi:putative membrane protein